MLIRINHVSAFTIRSPVKNIDFFEFGLIGFQVALGYTHRLKKGDAFINYFFEKDSYGEINMTIKGLQIGFKF